MGGLCGGHGHRGPALGQGLVPALVGHWGLAPVPELVLYNWTIASVNYTLGIVWRPALVPVCTSRRYIALDSTVLLPPQLPTAPCSTLAPPAVPWPLAPPAVPWPLAQAPIVTPARPPGSAPLHYSE